MNEIEIAITSLICLVLSFLLFRPYLSKINLISVFFIVTLIFNSLALFTWGVNPEYFIDRFPDSKFYVLTVDDYIKANIIINGGLILVLIFYVIGNIVINRGLIKPPNIFSPIPLLDEKYNFFNTNLLSIGISCLSILLLIGNASNIYLGITSGFFAGDYSNIIQARNEGGGNYLYVVLFYNILPISALIILLVNMVTRQYHILVFCMVPLALFGLLTSFSKTHILIFILILFLSRAYLKEVMYISQVQTSRIHQKSIFNIRFFALLLGGVFGLLMALYYLFGLGRGLDNNVDLFFTLAEVALSRTIGRLGMSIMLYAHYFPDIDSFYGFSNSKLLSTLFGGNFYPDTQILFKHFKSSRAEGSLAINATMDFYGAFGFTGWFTGCALVGTGLAVGETYLEKLGNTPLNTALRLYMMVFVYYLSQASLFRSLLGYGGVFFVGMWIIYRFFCVEKRDKK